MVSRGCLFSSNCYLLCFSHKLLYSFCWHYVALVAVITLSTQKWHKPFILPGQPVLHMTHTNLAAKSHSSTNDTYQSCCQVTQFYTWHIPILLPSRTVLHLTHTYFAAKSQSSTNDTYQSCCQSSSSTHGIPVQVLFPSHPLLHMAHPALLPSHPVLQFYVPALLPSHQVLQFHEPVLLPRHPVLHMAHTSLVAKSPSSTHFVAKLPQPYTMTHTSLAAKSSLM